MLTFPLMVFGVLIVLLVCADAARRQITGKTPALTRGRINLAVAGMVLIVVSFFLLPALAFVEYLL